MQNIVFVKEVFHFLNQFAPPSLAEEWDHIGLQVGSLKEKVRGVLVSLDVTEAVLQEARRLKANLLITHHPLFLGDGKSNLVKRLARIARAGRINILSFHTNLDSTEEGLNDLLANQLGLKIKRALLKSRDLKKLKAGLGRVGTIKKTNLKAFVKTIARKLKLKDLRYVGDPRQPIRQVAVVTGSGAGLFQEAKKAAAECLVTGDVKYHTALDALAEGIALVDIGHFAGEIGMVSLVAEKLRLWSKEKRLGLKIDESKVQEDPFRFWTN